MIDWQQWQTLLLISRYKTFAGAAKALSVDPTTIGRRIKHLENELGFELFIRTENQLTPTARCKTLLQHVETADDALHQVLESSTVDNFSKKKWREIRMIAPPFLINSIFAPSLNQLVKRQRIKASLLGTGNKAILSRHEADIAIRIDDREDEIKLNAPRIDAEPVGLLRYAVYAPKGINSTNLPWAGLVEPSSMTSGLMAMQSLTKGNEFQFRALHFDSLSEIVASAGAKAMLPCVVGDNDNRLESITDIVLEQPLWMLYHRNDRDISHFKKARKWVKEVMSEHGFD